MGFTLSLLLFFLFVRFVLPRVLRAVLGSFVRQQLHKTQQGGSYGPAGNPMGGYQTGNQQTQSQPEPPTRPGQVRVDYVPPTAAGNERKHEFRGGEYVDYEEVK